MKTWAIHNSLKGWTLYGLSERELQVLIKTMSINEIKLTQLCGPQNATWTILSDTQFPALFTYQQGDPNEFPNLDTRIKDVGDTEYFVIRPQKKTIHPRLHQRYEVEVICLVFSTTRQFTTSTIDLSEGGLYFTETIPDWVAGYFIVVVQAAGHVFQLMCSMVEDQKERKRVQIVSEEQDSQYVAYKDWLLTLNP